jgi:hypothetical protein
MNKPYNFVQFTNVLLYSITYSKELDLAVVSGIDSSGGAYIATSQDMVTWTRRTIANPNGYGKTLISGVKWIADKQKFYGTGATWNDGATNRPSVIVWLQSSDGVTWTRTEYTTPNPMNDGDRLLIFKRDTSIAYSPALDTFVVNLYLFETVGGNSVQPHPMYSTDGGATWTKASWTSYPYDTRVGYQIEWIAAWNKFVLAADSQLGESSDGQTWTPVSTIPVTLNVDSAYCLAWDANNNRLYTFGQTGYYTEDSAMATWTQCITNTSSFNIFRWVVDFNETMFCVVFLGNYSSNNGKQMMELNREIYPVQNGNAYFYVGINGTNNNSPGTSLIWLPKQFNYFFTCIAANGTDSYVASMSHPYVPIYQN